MSSISFGLPSIAGTSARILILGSLPGTASIKRQEYYAQPRNVFWRIMGDLFGIATSLPHDARAAALIEHQIAVWDVCAAARRVGSLDSNIQSDSVVANDFERFLSKHAKVGLICFNGAKASALFEARVVPNLSDELRKISRKILPSTSPAHASVSYEAKRAAWGILNRRVCSVPPADDHC